MFQEIKIEVPWRALKELIAVGTVTYRQLFDYWFRIDRTTVRQIPKSFEAFTKKHLKAFSLHTYNAEKDENWYFKLIRDLSGMSQGDVNALTSDHVIHLSPLFEFLSDTYVNEKSLIPKVAFLRGPQTRLKNISIEQLSFIDSFALAFHTEKEEKYLDLFFIAAYRFPFIGFTPWFLSHKWLYFWVSRKTKLAALTNYLGLRANLVRSHPNTFEGGDENDGLENFGWVGTILHLAGDKFGTFNNAKKVPVPEAFTLFEMNQLQIKKLKKPIK